MYSLSIILIFLSIGAFIVGEISPNVFKKIIKDPNRQKISIYCGAAIVIFYLLLSATSNKQVGNPSPTPAQNTTTEQSKPTETQKLYTYEIIKESTEGSTSTITVYTNEKTDSNLIAMNDEVFNKYRPGKTHIFINYFNDKELGKTYFDQMLDPNISEEKSKELFTHYIAQMKYNTTTGLKKFYKNGDNDGEWVELKSY